MYLLFLLLYCNDSNLFQVIEGSSSPLTDKHISIKCVGVNQLRYEILSGPDHGYLHLLINNSTVKNVTVFTEDDLYDSTLSYSHDGSENNHDHFKFLATSKNANFQVSFFFFLIDIP
jgi:hypothetical protein